MIPTTRGTRTAEVRALRLGMLISLLRWPQIIRAAQFVRNFSCASGAGWRKRGGSRYSIGFGPVAPRHWDEASGQPAPPVPQAGTACYSSSDYGATHCDPLVVTG